MFLLGSSEVPQYLDGVATSFFILALTKQTVCFHIMTRNWHGLHYMKTVATNQDIHKQFSDCKCVILQSVLAFPDIHWVCPHSHQSFWDTFLLQICPLMFLQGGQMHLQRTSSKLCVIKSQSALFRTPLVNKFDRENYF